jgi:hypothetical protein
MEERKVEEDEKQIRVTCFNCAEWDHFITHCKAPKLCFICQTANHVGRDCPEWVKPLELAQYLGSATQGLGFFHVNVVEEANRGGYMKFLDKCAILTIEEGDIGSEEIIKNLQ